MPTVSITMLLAMITKIFSVATAASYSFLTY